MAQGGTRRRLSLAGRYEQCTRSLAARPKLQELLVINVKGCKKMVDQPQGRRRPE